MRIIYKHTNKINGKSYIGYTPKTVTDVSRSANELMEARWKGHLHDALSRSSELALHRAIRKYGGEAFEHEVIEICETQTLKEVAEREIFWISTYETFGNNAKDYNMTPGGEGVTEMNEETKSRHRQATLDGMNVPEVRDRMRANFLAAVQDPEFRKNNSEAQKIAQRRPDVAEKRSRTLETTRDQRSIKMKKVHADPKVKIRHRKACQNSTRTISRNPTRIQLISQETGEVIETYSSIQSASKAFGVSRKTIRLSAKMNVPGSGKLWRYVPDDKKLPGIKCVELISPETNHVIETYQTVTAAAKATGTSKMSIKRSTDMNSPINGYLWRYVINNDNSDDEIE